MNRLWVRRLAGVVAICWVVAALITTCTTDLGPPSSIDGSLQSATS